MSKWGPKRTRLLNKRGVLNRESESFGADFWASGATPMVALGPRLLSVETESTGVLAGWR